MSSLTLSTFDTLRYAKRLKEADVPEKQAEAQAEALREVLADQSATQAQASAHIVAESDTKTEKAVLRLEGKIDLLEQRSQARFVLLQWMLGITLAGVGVILTKLFF